MSVSFLSWKRDLDKLKISAFANTDETPTPTPAAGTLIAQAVGMTQAAWMAKVRDTVRRGDVDVGLAPEAACTIYGWRVLLSRVRFPDGSYWWHLSTSLSPLGRPAVDRDWSMLDKIRAHLGAPKKPTIKPVDPNDVHHWTWLEAIPN